MVETLTSGSNRGDLQHNDFSVTRDIIATYVVDDREVDIACNEVSESEKTSWKDGA